MVLTQRWRMNENQGRVTGADLKTEKRTIENEEGDKVHNTAAHMNMEVWKSEEFTVIDVADISTSAIAPKSAQQKRTDMLPDQEP